MTENETLDRLWLRYNSTPFKTSQIKNDLNLNPGEPTEVVNLLRNLSQSEKALHGYRVQSPQATMYKLIQAQACDSDSPKGKPLPDENEAVTGEPESDSLSADEENDPFPAAPAELKALRQWVVWLYHLKGEDDKPSKMLFQNNGWAASSTTPSTWTDYLSAYACYEKYATGERFKYRYREGTDKPYQHLQCNLAGIGFVFSEDDPYTGIDIDNCLYRDESGKLQVKAWAQPIVDRLTPVSYADISPSGTGIKFWTKAKLPDWMNTGTKVSYEDGAIEPYHRGRYFTVTGKGKGIVADGQSVVDWLVKEHLAPKTEQAANTSPPRSAPTASSSSNLSADEVIEKIRNSTQVYKFDAVSYTHLTLPTKRIV